MIFAAAVVLSGCGSGPQTSGSFEHRVPEPTENGAYFLDVTDYVGIDFVHTLGDTELSNIVETVGSGAAWLDFDQDGYMDVYVANQRYHEGISEGPRPDGTSTDRLYRNVNGQGFVDVTDRAGIAGEKGYGIGLAVADFDNDGFPDVYVCNYGANFLWHNNGNGTFTDIAGKLGVAGNENSVGAVWLDYDNDGHLDLYVGNYLEFDPAAKDLFYGPDGLAPPMSYAGQQDYLYHNQGDGTFKDVTDAMGVAFPEGRMMGVGAADYDGDGWTDIYVSNDAMPDYLFHNEKGMRFTEVGFPMGVAFSIGGEETSSMAVDFQDYNGDGLLDLWVTDIHFSALYRNGGSGSPFSDVTVEAGIAAPSGQYDGWGSSFLDYDNDGDLDIYKANGSANHLYGQEDQVFENTGTGTFLDASQKLGAFFSTERVGRGAAFGDYDNDGDIDVFLVPMQSRAVVLRNQGLSGNRSICLLLQGTTSNRDGVGARVTVTAGGHKQVQEKRSSFGYVSSNDPRLSFGIGKNDVAEKVEIRWPSGKVQVLANVKAGEVVRVKEPVSADIAGK